MPKRSSSRSSPPPEPSWLAGLLPGAGRERQEEGRLDLQAGVYDPLTRRFLAEAGLSPGMRVLDVGSGTGAVSLLAAELVGPTGSVTGIEAGADRVERAAGRAREAGRANVSFLQGHAGTVGLKGRRFDAIVGRFVLRELGGGAPGILRRLCRHLAPGGIVAFQEKVLAVPVASFPPVAAIETARGWMDEARRLAGVEVTTGASLPRIYAAAGLPSPELRLDAPVGHGPGWTGYRYLAETLRGMMPLMHLYGIASPEEIGIEDLADRIRAEALALSALVILTPCIGAWAVRRRARPRTARPA